MGWDGWSALAGLGSVVLALAAVTVALTAFQSERRRARWENARALHHDLTSGEVAAARHRMGRMHYGHYALSTPATDELDEDLQAYFTVLWCFGRIEAGQHTLIRASSRQLADEAVDYLDGLIHWHVAEYVCGFRRARLDLMGRGGADVSDGHSKTAFTRLAADLLREQPQGPMMLGEHCDADGTITCPCSCHQIGP